jgi:NhaP-type Na+/H+ or K+/H+ antiporter
MWFWIGLQCSVMIAVLCANIYWQLTPNGVLAGLLAIGAAWLVTRAVSVAVRLWTQFWTQTLQYSTLRTDMRRTDSVINCPETRTERHATILDAILLAVIGPRSHSRSFPITALLAGRGLPFAME